MTDMKFVLTLLVQITVISAQATSEIF